MTDRTETLEVGANPHISISLPAGDIRFKGGDDGSVVVQLSGSREALEAIHIDAGHDTVVVSTPGRRRRWARGGSVDAVVTLPPMSDVTVGLGAGDVLVGLPVRSLEVHAGAGDVRAEDVSGTTEVKLGSGDIRLGVLGGAAKISSAAGDVRIDAAVDLTASTAAGDLNVGDVTESGRIKSATGDVRVGSFSGSDLEIKTMSGDVSVGLIPGMVLNAGIKTMSGELRNRIEPSSADKTRSASLTITSVSGDVTLRTA